MRQVNSNLLGTHTARSCPAPAQRDGIPSCTVYHAASDSGPTAAQVHAATACKLSAHRHLLHKVGSSNPCPIMQGVTLKSLIELKAMALAERQRLLREHVACEQRLQQDASLCQLAEWSHLRRAMPTEETLPALPLVPPMRRSTKGYPSVAEVQAQAQRQGPRQFYPSNRMRHTCFLSTRWTPGAKLPSPCSCSSSVDCHG